MRWRIQWRHCISSTLQPGKLRIPQITLTHRPRDTHIAEKDRQRDKGKETWTHIPLTIYGMIYQRRYEVQSKKCLTSSNTFFCIFWIEHLRAILGNLQPCHNLFITVNHRKCWSILVLSLYVDTYTINHIWHDIYQRRYKRWYRVMPCLWKRNEIFFILIHHRKR